jgi:hypothetical protein
MSDSTNSAPVPAPGRWSLTGMARLAGQPPCDFRLAPLISILVLIAGAAISRPFLDDVLVRPSDGFIAYYTASRLVLSGRDAAGLYDDAVFRDETKALRTGADDIYYVNPPTTALLLLPVAGLDYRTARSIWILCTLALLLLSGAWIAFSLKLIGWRLVALAALPFFFEPLATNLEHGQMYVLAALLFVMAWDSYRFRRDPVLGIALALLFMTKLAGLPLLLLLAWQRRFKALVWAAGTSIAILVLTLPLLGLSSWLAFVRLLTSLGAEPGLASPAYQSLPGLFRQLTTFDPVFSTEPLVNLPVPGKILYFAAFVGLLGLTLKVERGSGRLDLPFIAMIVLSVALSPLSADYHFTVMFLPIAVLLRATAPGRWSAAILAVAVGLIAADLAPKNPVPSYATFGGYARLLGSLMLWALAIWNSRVSIGGEQRPNPVG